MMLGKGHFWGKSRIAFVLGRLVVLENPSSKSLFGTDRDQPDLPIEDGGGSERGGLGIPKDKVSYLHRPSQCSCEHSRNRAQPSSAAPICQRVAGRVFRGALLLSADQTIHGKDKRYKMHALCCSKHDCSVYFFFFWRWCWARTLWGPHE